MPLDAIRSLGAKMLLNKYFEDFGEVTEVDIDPSTSLASLLILLKGEGQRVRLDVGYRLEEDAFVLVHFRCERQWIENALNRFLAEKRFDIGSSFSQTMLKFVL